MKHASLCLLAFERADFLERTLSSLVMRTKYPYELIVHNDGSLDPKVKQVIEKYREKIAIIVDNCGKNMGVGASMRRCANIATGDYIFKMDADLEFSEGWLEQCVNILDNNQSVSMVGCFDYYNNYTKDERFTILEQREDCKIVKDFVNSIYGFRRKTYDEYGSMMGDDGWQQEVTKFTGEMLAITKEDVVYNFGFGLQNSIYMNPDGTQREKSATTKIC